MEQISSPYERGDPKPVRGLREGSQGDVTSDELIDMHSRLTHDTSK